jgi:hypothetical protein
VEQHLRHAHNSLAPIKQPPIRRKVLEISPHRKSDQAIALLGAKLASANLPAAQLSSAALPVAELSSVTLFSTEFSTAKLSILESFVTKLSVLELPATNIFLTKQLCLPELVPGKWSKLIFKCSSDDPSKNIIVPVLANSDVPTDNYLGGTLFDKKFPKHNAYKTYDASTMRVLGVNNKGELSFTTAKSSELTDEKFIPKNTCWLNVPNGLSGDFKLVSRDAYTGIQTIEATPKKNAVKGTFTLSGVHVDDSKALRRGIYIRNGEKVVIKQVK